MRGVLVACCGLAARAKVEVKRVRFASRRTILRDGTECTLRPLRRTDARALGDYFLGLSERTRSLFAPHPFDREAARAVCRGGGERAVRCVALCGRRIVGYGILALEPAPADEKRYGKLRRGEVCAVAPSVAEDFRGRSLGTRLFEYVADVARALGKKKMVLMGGVQARNAAAVRFYKKLGFKKAGEFMTEYKCYDMVLDL